MLFNRDVLVITVTLAIIVQVSLADPYTTRPINMTAVSIFKTLYHSIATKLTYLVNCTQYDPELASIFNETKQSFDIHVSKSNDEM